MERRTFLGAAGIAAAAGLLTRHSKAFARPPRRPSEETDPAGQVNLTTRTWVTGRALSGAPAVDGTFSAAAWDDAPQLDQFGLVYDPGVVDDGTYYRMGWHGERLYLGGRINADLAAGLARLLVVIDPDPADDTFALIDAPINPVRTTGPAFLDLDWRPENQWVQQPIEVAVPHATDPDTGELTVELAVDFDQLGITGPPTGEWGFTIIHLTEMGGPRITAWSPIPTANYAEAAVSGLGEPAAFEASIASHHALGQVLFDTAQEETWDPAACSLNWVSPTRKRLRLSIADARDQQRRSPVSPQRSDVTLTWVDPDGVSEDLTGELELTQDQLLATFDHPLARTPGRYQLQVRIAGPARRRVARIGFDREDLVTAGIAVIGDAFPVTGGTAVTPAPPSAEVTALIELLPAQFGIPHIGHPEEADIRPQFANWRLAEDRQHIVHIPSETSDDPDRVSEFPSPDYPETHADIATNALGETVEYPYYEDAQGKRYFFTAALWNHQTRYVRSALVGLAESDPLGAARLLHRFAEVARGYVLRSNSEWNTHLYDSDSGPAYNRRAGYWSVWTAEELNHFADFLTAYRTIAATDAFTVLSQELDRDVLADLRNNLFQPAIDYVLSCVRGMHNTDPYVWRQLVQLGRALGVPDFVHRTTEWIDGFMRSQFLSDGFWKEATIAYHSQVIGNVAKALAELDGYSDPPEYVSPRSGMRIDDLDLTENYPQLADQQRLQNILTYPDRRQVPIQDTWAHTMRLTDPEPGPFVRSRVGLTRLEVGTGAGRTQLYLMSTPKYGHDHYDPLSIALYGAGQELLPDIGYTYTKYRQFAASTIGHNTVLVDGANMVVDDTSRHGGAVERFNVFDDAQFVSVSYASAFPAVSSYRRTVLMRALPDGGSCAVDLFAVVGGSRHEYVLHGDANRDARFETAAQLEEYGEYLLPPGTEVRPPVDWQDFGEAGGHYPGYQYLRQVSSTALPVGCQQLELITIDDNGVEAGKLSVLSASDGEDTLFLGRSPSLRATRLYGNGVDYDNDEQADAYSLPAMVQRREGDDLSSTFITTLEPFRGEESSVELCVRLAVDSGAADAVAVRLVHGEVTTVMVHNPHGDREVVVGDLRLSGEYGEATFHAGALRELRLIGGSEIAVGDTVLTGDLPSRGTVVATTRKADGAELNGLFTDSVVPAEAVGERIVVRHPDATSTMFTIEGVSASGSGSRIDIGSAEPGFVFDQTGASTETHYPVRQWGTRDHTFEVVTAVTESYDLAAPDLPTGQIDGVVVDPDGDPIESAQVKVTGYPQLTAITGTDGTFSIAGIPVDDHHLTVRKDDWFRAVPGPWAVAEAATVSVEVELTPRPVRPELTEITHYQLVGEPVSAVLPSAGTLYLVPADTPRVLADLEAAVAAGTGVSASGEAGPMSLPTTDLSLGSYRLYLAGADESLSAGYPVTLIPDGIGTVEDEDPLVNYTGTWARLDGELHSGGGFRYTQDVGGSVEFGFWGRGATVKGHTNDAGGLADVFVDGEQVATLDYYSAEIARQYEIFDTGDLPLGLHVVKIVARGARDPQHPDNPYAQVRFDAAIIRQSDSPAELELTEVTRYQLVDDPVEATASHPGTLYLVPADTAAAVSELQAAVTSGTGRSEPVEAGVVSVPTSDLPPGHYQLYLVDAEQTMSAGEPVTMIPATVASLEDDDPMVSYTGSWTRYPSDLYSGGGFSFTEAGSMEFAFHGTGATVKGHTNDAGGLADVFVDGEQVGTLDYYSAEIVRQVEMFDTGDLPAGIHVVRIVGRKARDPQHPDNPYAQVRFDVAIIRE